MSKIYGIDWKFIDTWYECDAMDCYECVHVSIENYWAGETVYRLPPYFVMCMGHGMNFLRNETIRIKLGNTTYPWTHRR